MPLNALYDLPAPAKLNLFLHVIGRRADGYHLLQSVFTMIDWADTLHLERRHDGRLRRHDLGPALPDDDLCLKAARLLQAESGSTLGADISIDKRVPWGAGLGGGSSDAATVLIGLNRLWGLNWPRERLLALGARLGADVPFFIGGHTAWVEGIGEKLTPITLAPQHYAVVKPAESIATAAIFSSSLLTRDSDAVIVAGFLADANALVRDETAEAKSLGGFPGRNDLQRAAEALCPEVAEVGRWLQARFGNSRMTGSGSAVYARAGTGARPVATMLEGLLDRLPEGWVGRMCRSLDVHPLAGWLG
ncbi:4-(cytidine 5'-diphospho)-2-C-methyl-D-erythritol kinase [Ideonella sp.]|uniref:4-(cytidine 5'-diphospho)-2-C-methyl-D-erythritol kinase n=1 Tax=Ideonella sp. TaxID=1929293 RepID=UPI002B47574A|nr:4-(cytidine 5'-diphospho)-2-C-methyl-D-erythritol kinase [Ideonella sp.]HJV69570.1 4-(cytidine 5'-diphospho)-2-C-methyl-D-erythritol kinase [Ideonella sp.]